MSGASNTLRSGSGRTLGQKQRQRPGPKPKRLKTGQAKQANLTPLGQRLRALRTERGVSAVEMARALNVSPAYLSALEHGQRGKPSARFMHLICQYFNIIWDEADALHLLAELSDPKLRLDTSDLTAEHTLLANRFARSLPKLTQGQARRLLRTFEKLDRDPDVETSLDGEREA